MGVFKKWKDGWSLDGDPRREDPLVYYLPRGNWAHAIGLQMLPAWEEREAAQVEISVCDQHRDREESLSDTDRELLYVRSIPFLAKQHANWKRIVVRANHLHRIVGSGLLTEELRKLGFEPGPGANDGEALWSRA